MNNYVIVIKFFLANQIFNCKFSASFCGGIN